MAYPISNIGGSTGSNADQPANILKYNVLERMIHTGYKHESDFMMDLIGLYEWESPVTNDVVSSWEQLNYIAKGQINVVTASAADTITFTLSTTVGQFINDVPNWRIDDQIEFIGAGGHRIQALVTARTLTGTAATVDITVVRLQTTDNLTTITNGQWFAYIGNAKSYSSGVQTHIGIQPTEFTHTLQMIAEGIEGDGSAMTNEWWIKTGEMVRGTDKNMYSLDTMAAILRFRRAEAQVLMVGKGSNNATVNANRPFTEGVSTQIFNRNGVAQPYNAGSFLDVQDLRNWTKLMRLNKAEKQNLLLGGQNFIHGFEEMGWTTFDQRVTYNAFDVAGADEMNMKPSDVAINLGFKGIGLGGYELYLRPYELFHHADTLGQAGSTYNGVALCMPLDMMPNPGSGRGGLDEGRGSIPPFEVIYKKLGNNDRRYMEARLPGLTGSEQTANVATFNDVDQLGMKCHVGMRLCGATRYSIFYEAGTWS